MTDLDAAIDALYQGPLDAFTDARNALAKAAKRPDLKTLAKPSLPAWAVNQLHWHRRAALDRLLAAAAGVRRAHGDTLAGKAADVGAAEQAHRDAVKATLAEAREVLAAAGHPVTQATLDAVRDTLQVLPSPDANGRLVKPLAPTGFAALAGFAVAERPALRMVPPSTGATGAARSGRATGDDDAAARALAARAAEREARERRKAAEKAVEDTRAALRRAEIALDDAERVLKRRRAEHDQAAAAHQRAEAALKPLG